MGDRIVVESVNVAELLKAFEDAPDLTLLYIRQEMQRFAPRFRKSFIKSRMSGTPGIKWTGGRNKVGKNVRSGVYGNSLSELRFVTSISRFLRVHEEGATINPKKGNWLYLSRKTGVKGAGDIFARVRSVTVPARLGFQVFAKEQIQADLLPKIGGAMQRAMRVAMERRMRVVGGYVSEFGNAG